MPEKRPSAYRAEWDSLKAEDAAIAAEGKARRGLLPGNPAVEAQEARIASLVVRQDAVAHGAWEATAQDLADLLILAEIAWSSWWGLGTFPQLPADIDEKDQREVAIAYLVRGVFDVSIGQGHIGGAQP
jgi:hypothetical protein